MLLLICIYFVPCVVVGLLGILTLPKYMSHSEGK